MKLWSKDIGPGDSVMALSLWEPWASLMALGAKKIETRSWLTRYRGPLLICASKRRRVGEFNSLLRDWRFSQALYPLASSWLPGIDDLGFGNALALVDLYEVCSTTAHLSLGISDQEHAFGDYSPGRFGWSTCGRRRIKPFPVIGRQGLFRVTLPHDFEDWSADS